MGLPGAPALQRSFLRCPRVPPPVLPFPRPLQELRPPRRVGARGPVLLSVLGKGCALHREALEMLLGLQIEPYEVLPLLQRPSAIAKGFSLQT